jgi:hypothetical protein
LRILFFKNDEPFGFFWRGYLKKGNTLWWPPFKLVSENGKNSLEKIWNQQINKGAGSGPDLKFQYLSALFSVIGITSATNSSDVYLRGSLQGKELRVVTGHIYLKKIKKI